MPKLITRHHRRGFLAGAGALAASTLAAPFIIRRAHGAEDNLLIVNTWGGVYSEIERKHLFDPFTKETGIKIQLDTPVNFAKLKAQVESKNYLYDISSINSVDLTRALIDGLLEPIDWDMIDRSKFDNLVFHNHGVGLITLGTVLAYRKDKFPNGGPQDWVDFFDVQRFPGPRSMGKRSFSTLSFAALGAGKPLNGLYPLDLDAAFGALDRIKPSLKSWWEGGNQSEQLIRDGEVHLMSIWSERPVRLVKEGLPVEIVWNQAETVPGFYYLAKGAPHKKAAMKFFEFVSRPEVQAPFAEATYYGPTNPRAIALMNPENARFMSTHQDYLKVGFQPDADWVGRNLAQIERRFIRWLAG